MLNWRACWLTRKTRLGGIDFFSCPLSLGGSSRQNEAMSNPYQSPQPAKTKDRLLARFGIALLILAVVLPIAGIAVTVAGVVNVTSELSESDSMSPEDLAKGVNFANYATVIGFLAGLLSGVLGVALLIMSWQRNRALEADQYGG